MKQFTLVIEGCNFTKERLERACNFLADALQIGGTQAGDITMSINFNQIDRSQILDLAKKHEITDLTS